LLVLCDNDYPGWRAYIDDVRVDVLRANHTMRAVEVPAGRHMVTFVFKPAAFFTSMYISIAAAVMAVAALILGAIKRKRE
ncbi:MAG: YfhO family protein, partial [Blastocatellia bacterium]